MFEKKSIRKGAVHWHMLLWVKPGTAPNHAIMPEVPKVQIPPIKCAYLRKFVMQMMQHKVCVPSRCLREASCIMQVWISVPCSKIVRCWMRIV